MGNTALQSGDGVAKLHEVDSSCETTMFSVSVATSKSNVDQDNYIREPMVSYEGNDIMMNQSVQHHQQGFYQSGQDMGGMLNSNQMMGYSNQHEMAQQHPTSNNSYEQDTRNRYYSMTDYQNESPQNYSDPSTDGDSMHSDAYKLLLQKDYLSNHEASAAASHQRSSVVSQPKRSLPQPPAPFTINNHDDKDLIDDKEAAKLDINLDFTLHVGKLVVYVKKLEVSSSFIEDVIGEVSRLKGRVKCSLLTPGKSQRYTSSVFEAVTVATSKNFMSAEMDEMFVYYLFPRHQIDGMALQFKLCGSRALFKDIVLAESFVRLGEVNLTSEMLPLTVDFVDFGSGKFAENQHSKQSKKAVLVPKSGKLEILLSLQYISQTSSLIIDIKQSTRLGKLREFMCREIILQAEIISAACECLQRKTTFLKMTIDNPGCNKPFEFNLGQDQLYIQTLMLSVSYSAGRWNSQEKIGWISFGKHCSGQLEANHWDDMIRKSAVHEAAIQWHCLCENQQVNGNPLFKILK